MGVVDALDDLGLAHPQAYRCAFAGHQVREGRAPRATADDGDVHALPRVRNRFSVPAKSRRMLARCVTKISAASTTAAQNVGPASGCVSLTHNGNVPAA